MTLVIFNVYKEVLRNFLVNGSCIIEWKSYCYTCYTCYWPQTPLSAASITRYVMSSLVGPGPTRLVSLAMRVRALLLNTGTICSRFRGENNVFMCLRVTFHTGPKHNIEHDNSKVHHIEFRKPSLVEHGNRLLQIPCRKHRVHVYACHLLH